MELCLVLNRGSWVYGYCNSLGLIDKVKMKESQIQKKGCVCTAARDWNKSYYTGAIKASKLHDLLSLHHKADRKGIHITTGDIS